MTRLIAIEKHFVTPAIRAAWAASASGQENTAVLDRGEIEALLGDRGEQRLPLLDKSGVDVRVRSVTTPSLHHLDPEPSVPLAWPCFSPPITPTVLAGTTRPPLPGGNGALRRPKSVVPA